jgi:hypothetical protein
MRAKAEEAGFSTARYVCKVVLSQAQRRTILGLASVNGEINELLRNDASKTATFNLSVDEIVTICHALAEALQDAEGKYRNQLFKVAEKMSSGLNEGLTGRKQRPRSRRRPQTAYQLKITLKEVRPVVWRQLQVFDCTLPVLHDVIQVVMGWENCHLYEFRVGDVRYSDPSLCEDWEGLDGRRVKLSHLLKQGHQQFEYVYDLGDDWQHMVEIESAFQPEEGANFPACIEGVGNCPPEDVGGSSGYAKFLRSINDLDDAQHKDYLEWVGGWFDPDAFDLELVNRALTRLNG